MANTGTEKANIVHVRHASGVDVVLAAVADMYGAFGKLNVYGTTGSLTAALEDTFYAFKPNWRRLSATCARASRRYRSPKPWR